MKQLKPKTRVFGYPLEFNLCSICFNFLEEFEKWSGGKPFACGSLEERKEFWEYASENLVKVCIMLGPEDHYYAPYCLDCLNELAIGMETCIGMHHYD